jgi:hypothetical protein
MLQRGIKKITYVTVFRLLFVQYPYVLDTDRQNLFAKISQKRSLIFYCDVKFESVREEYTICCTRNERRGLDG